MRALFFSTESWRPAGEMIMRCFYIVDAQMQVTSMSKYCDVIDTIGIIPFSGPEERMADWKERKYISWKRREADIRLRIDFDSFVNASFEVQQEIVNKIIIQSLKVIKSICDNKKVRFDIDALLQDVFPDKSM